MNRYEIHFKDGSTKTLKDVVRVMRRGVKLEFIDAKAQVALEVEADTVFKWTKTTIWPAVQELR